MRPRRTVRSNFTYVLENGTEDNDLWAERGEDEDGFATIATTWVPTEGERRAIANGANIEVTIWSRSHPAMAVGVSDTPLGRPPSTGGL
jgi:hypothetical protein